jgi:hypothetical protein
MRAIAFVRAVKRELSELDKASLAHLEEEFKDYRLSDNSFHKA